ncbi:MAG: glutamine--fructose-6-phosphate transaminase (isomerizing) [Candidatus Wildermuthbacteria bacterium]|nr:glutamine--fructose-6-phosphate transaminase (isomerizing) [Candidatus Wildermuthbacteria bacterium]
MCGIIGYVGKLDALPILLEGLRRESYRGYDSSGVAVLNGEGYATVKAVGKLENLEKKLDGSPLVGTLGIGHSRWATHGGVSEENAHPHIDCAGNIVLAHNGIIENHRQLKEALKTRGHVFSSQTDTEVLAHLVEHFFRGDVQEAVRRALCLVKGTYGLVVIAKQDPGKIVAARLSSPLVLSVNGSGGFVASDPSAIVSHSKRMVFLEDREIAVITESDFFVTDLANAPKEKTVVELEWNIEEAQKGGFAHFMHKEIHEQPESVQNAMRGRILETEGDAKLGGIETLKDRVREIERLNIIACGTSLYAGLVGRYMLEEYAKIPTQVDLASEFRYRNPVLDGRTASLFVSQSGETADTLGALREVKRKGGLTLGIVNVIGSSLAREIDAGIYNHAGPEIGVASTKAFTSQITAFALLTLHLARQKGMSLAAGRLIAKHLLGLPALIERALSQSEALKALAEKYAFASNFLYIGRKYQYPVALEGALKLKEISYVHAEGQGAGEMKHGPIALIDKTFPTLALCPSDSVYEKMVSNIQEIKARNGLVIAVASEGNTEIADIADDVIYIPKTLEMLTPIVSVIPLQLFAYHMAVLKGHDPDKPRNLAKSVTVE